MREQVSLGKRAVRLALCATAIGSAMVAQSAYAVVITNNIAAVVPFNIDGFYLNVVTGVMGTSGSSVPGYDINPYFSGSTTPASTLFRLLTPSTGGTVAASSIATQLPGGSVVGPASTFASGVVNANATNSDPHYFGFRFVNEATGITNYGYLTVVQTANPPVAGSVTVMSYTYDNTGAAVTVVPEPSTAMMLLGGLLGAGALRKRLAAKREMA